MDLVDRYMPIMVTLGQPTRHFHPRLSSPYSHFFFGYLYSYDTPAALSIKLSKVRGIRLESQLAKSGIEKSTLEKNVEQQDASLTEARSHMQLGC